MKKVLHEPGQVYTQSDGSETNYDLFAFHDSGQKPAYFAVIRETIPVRRDALLRDVVGLLQETYLCEPDQVRLYGIRPDAGLEQVNLSGVPTRSVGTGMLATQDDKPLPWGAGRQVFYSKTPLDPETGAAVLQEINSDELSEAMKTRAQRAADAGMRELKTSQVPPNHRPVLPDPVETSSPLPTLDPPLPRLD